MLNYIWLGMIAVSVAVAMVTGSLETVGTAVLARAQGAVMDVMLPLGGIMTLWMGIMRLVEVSGLIHVIARVLSPLMRLVFPDVPKGHPALGSIAMNLGANMLGAGNSATPLGLRAMQQLNQLNPHPGVASNAMVMLLALNTASITLIPASTIGLLQSQGAANPTDIIAPSLLASVAGTACAILICWWLQRTSWFKVIPLPPEEQPPVAEVEGVVEDSTGRRLKWWGKGVAGLAVLGFLAALIWYVADGKGMTAWQAHWYRQVTGAAPDGVAWFGGVPNAWHLRFFKFISMAAVPGAMAFFVLYAALAGVKVFEVFVEGAKDGMQVVFRVIPYVVGMLVAIAMFTQSGAMRLVEYPVRWFLSLPGISWLGFPVETLPMVIIRPLSGGAATAVLSNIIEDQGVNSMITKIAATMNGSSETTLYVAAVYYGAVRVKRMRHGIPAGLLADAAAVIFAVIFCRWLLGK
ncbi:MAG: Nucleoside recognition protein [Verrucomicrobiales bacterium]|nr:Nucleoside recognition protein [Verrucomicrobiales bacterium]